MDVQEELVFVTRDVQMAITHDEVCNIQTVQVQNSVTNTNFFSITKNGTTYIVSVVPVKGMTDVS